MERAIAVYLAVPFLLAMRLYVFVVSKIRYRMKSCHLLV